MFVEGNFTVGRLGVVSGAADRLAARGAVREDDKLQTCVVKRTLELRVPQASCGMLAPGDEAEQTFHRYLFDQVFYFHSG